MTLTTLNYPGFPPIQTEVVTETTKCEECGGQGYDWRSRFEYEPCEECGGEKTITVQRNYLAEALHIASGKTNMQPELKHLQAIVKHAREFVSAAISFPEAA